MDLHNMSDNLDIENFSHSKIENLSSVPSLKLTLIHFVENFRSNFTFVLKQL